MCAFDEGKQYLCFFQPKKHGAVREQELLEGLCGI